MKPWAASVALHGAAAAAAALLWTDLRVEPKAEPMRWQVVFASPQPAADVPPQTQRQETARQPTPPAEPRQPAPQPSAMPPREAIVPLPATATDVPAAAPPAASDPPTPTPPHQESAPSHAADEIERRWYLALLEQLRALKRYPMTARRLGQEGVVLIEARIGADGQLENMAVKQGSGHPMLDRSALELFESAAAKARHQLRPERPTRLEIPIAYKLES